MSAALSNQLKVWLEQNVGPSMSKGELLLTAFELEPQVFFRSWTWDYTIGSPGSPPCLLQILGLVNLQNCISKFLIIKLCIYTSIYFLLVLFLWRNLTSVLTKKLGKLSNRCDQRKSYSSRVWRSLDDNLMPALSGNLHTSNWELPVFHFVIALSLHVKYRLCSIAVAIILTCVLLCYDV